MTDDDQKRKTQELVLTPSQQRAVLLQSLRDQMQQLTARLQTVPKERVDEIRAIEAQLEKLRKDVHASLGDTQRL
ncbi:MAG: hypothetical protein H0W83_13485 [Planctomycetes bacterium]|nr:hypothetical protein [Planctomycetota bacterium]